ncbi:hypothetical protein GCM10007301_36940 [Azorhizobium oxalatiphilum]|uniref:Uncharacterized protein n=1 Tax=Azorhizobium oxalatiphilum TaxID=980631 RepID=A0A917FFU0_9HYPH|nr:hypothetical protein [Azorhizobium oxalatiphilum]GGF73749.1 hypothetical protein GCM10007301_36940 [Azorhizobium oxalatiphilum]
MISTRLACLLAACLIGSTAPALADKASSEACAAGLSADGKTIYKASAPAITPTANIRDVVTEKTRSLVMGGSIGRANAKTDAEAAGGCLAMLKP